MSEGVKPYYGPGERLPVQPMTFEVKDSKHHPNQKVVDFIRKSDGAGLSIFFETDYGQLTAYWHGPGKEGGPQALNVIVNVDGTLDVSVAERHRK